ncbi:microsomal signal peptidase 25 kDa subunit-domain-containing protein [Corynascus novoguineensis]|uniref:Signal peptidase complex subunit 2 n=1 Tax=Corynascus novoguineensis TaxID=1126955 RepID=A0AAN7HT13_9PEZI|nr:microsomal signal peptidase 25 kDa subunit-domain-containing protein [Corynascus novoguineensis]
MAASQERITVYNLADLKNTSDDALPNYLNSIGFTQSHRLTDVRLALGYSAFALAAACFAWDYRFGFDATKHLTAAAVALYALLNGALTLWVLYAERGTVYVGTSRDGAETLRVSTATRKNVPEYLVTVEVTRKGAAPEEIKFARSFTEWFDEAGHFVAAPFQAAFANSVPAIGRADPKKVATAAKGKEGSDGSEEAAAYTPEMLDMLAKANVSVVGSAAEEATGSEAAAKKKGGKRRKA